MGLKHDKGVADSRGQLESISTVPFVHSMLYQEFLRFQHKYHRC